MRLLLFQLVPIVVLLLPLLEVAGLTVYWRRSITSPWLYALIGCIVAYAIAAGVVFATERYSSAGGSIVFRGYFLEKVEPDRAAKSKEGPTFAPLTMMWAGFLATILILCAVALWCLKFFFRSGSP